ncbi:hypothetical protein [Piscirickettsia litoralis]|uniref:DUF541 domain-containing protein n=1 Tax=Piscirickettsia litoralis TaxID=1891921 RepID=A0ABX3A3V2_9GAMM|nr:hypothetical protein [Piscirickettsia litoralis]ODN43314.1 hypothetical protein BGC07_10755 [Piscirickettsia litoralis]
MKKALSSLFLATMITAPAFAAPPPPPAQNNAETIKFSIKDENYVQVQSAKVSVLASITATGDQRSFETILAPVLKTEKNARIEQVMQTKSDSGLPQYKVLIVQRVGMKNINKLTSRYKSYDKPGMSFKVVDISYSPTSNQFENKWAKMRLKLYKEIQQEIKSYNKLTNKEFKIKSIQYWHSNNIPRIQPVMLKSFAMGAANAEQAAVSNNSSNVTTKVEMTANVELTSTV